MRTLITILALSVGSIAVITPRAVACDDDGTVVIANPDDVQTFDVHQMLAYGYGGASQQAFAPQFAPQYAPDVCDVGAQQQVIVRQQAPRVIYQQQAPQRVIVRQQAPIIVRQRAPVYAQQYSQRSFISRGQGAAFAPGDVGVGGGGITSGRRTRIKFKNSPGASVSTGGGGITSGRRTKIKFKNSPNATIGF